MSIRVLVYRPFEEPDESYLKEDKTLEALQKLVGGNVDVIRLGGGLDLWVNDEFLMNGSLPNRMVNGQPIMGTMVLARSDSAGRTRGLSAGDIDLMWNAWPLILAIGTKEDTHE